MNTTIIATAKQTEFELLFAEFRQQLPQQPVLQKRMVSLSQARGDAQRNYAQLIGKATPPKESLDDGFVIEILNKLLPHSDTANNRWRSAWVHPSPVLAGDARRWYESSGVVQPSDWSQVAAAILSFVKRCCETPAELGQACQTFSASPFSRGFQSGTLSPILNALQPEHFAVFDTPVRNALNYFSDTNFSQSLTDYPAAMTALHTLLEKFSPLIDPPIDPLFSRADHFDLFARWLAASKKSSKALGLRQPTYWAVALGDGYWQWEEWRDNLFVAVAWDDLGDLSQLTRRQFEQRRDSLVTQYLNWSKQGANQVWNFARRVRPGDQIVVHHTGHLLLGVGEVSGDYSFVEETPFSHHLPMRWLDTTARTITQASWRAMLLEITATEFTLLQQAPKVRGDLQQLISDEATPDLAQSETPIFLRFCLPILEIVRSLGHSASANVVIDQLIARFALPAQDLSTFTSAGVNRLKSQIERARTLLVKAGVLEPGHRQQWRLTAQGMTGAFDQRHFQEFYHELQYQRRLKQSLTPASPTIQQLAESQILYQAHSPESADVPVERSVEPEEVEEIVALIEQPVTPPRSPEIAASAPAPLLYTEPYRLVEVAQATYLDGPLLEKWVRAIERKGQAIFYGPPGVGKTFLARQLARHLSGGGDGFWEIVQFHPAYEYEDFVQGIRPQPTPTGLSYNVVPGRFLDFCRRAAACGGRCVLIIDEINRANLARVFGELMHLLEYREEQVRLAADGVLFQIPTNVRILGTMNTADRSIAVVDHALRRRFAFIAMQPNFEVLRRFHEQHKTFFPIEPLVELLRSINQQIGDPNYALGVSFFLRQNLINEIEAIWQQEIEPYLEEYFFDRPAQVDELRWERVRFV